MKKGNLIVVSGPSGVGKGTICKEIIDEKLVSYSVSMTSRKPRFGEVDGVNYYFVDEKTFEKAIDNDELLEYANVHGNYYGTPIKKVLEILEKGKDILLEIDIQGALQVKNKIKEAILIFILPPSMEELKNRIIKRGTETEESLNIRLKNAYEEIKYYDKYDYCFINENIDESVEILKIIIKSLKYKVK